MQAWELDRSEEKLRRALDTLPTGAYTCDADGLITYYNQRAVDLWGRRPKLNDPADRFCGSFKLFTLEGEPIQHDQCWMGLALRDGKEYLAQEIVIERPDGKRWTALAHASPFRDENGVIVGAVNVLVDISDRRHAETARAQLAAIVDSSDDAIISKDLNGIVQSWNMAAQRLFGYTAQQAVGRHISFLIPPDRISEEELIITRLRAGERIKHFDTVRVASDGSQVHVSLTISPIRDEVGRIVGASKIARNIADRKEAEDRIYSLMTQLKEADQRKDEFLAMLAHELRSPLAPLRNLLEIMNLGGGTSEVIEQMRPTLERQLKQMVRLVDDLLDVSRITRGKLELRKERVELAPVVQQGVEACRPLVESSRHELTVSLPPEPVLLSADGARISQVVSNLLNNACKYTPSGGRIALSVERCGSDVVISVKDNGVGIPPDKLASVFDMFTQVSDSSEMSQGGLGIGLTLVKQLVEMHGGFIEASSAGPGQGSEFVVRLPLLLERPRPRPSSSRRVDSPSQATARRILIVDDNRDAARSLSMLLKLTGNQTSLAYDGLEALEMAEKTLPEVVLLDLGLPKLNGYDVCRHIRRQAWGQNMVLVALTGWAQDEDRRQSKEAGFDHHMVKPVDLADLTHVLNDVGATPVSYPWTSTQDAEKFRS
jgi:PAS domain S-box-containing protein